MAKGNTRFPNGVAQYIGTSVGAAAGDVPVVGGIKKGDKLLRVVVVSFDGDGDTVASADLTSEFTITADDTINNTGGTSTADSLVLVQWASAV